MNVDYFTARPSKGSAGKTGEWRTFRPEIIHERCVLCMSCVEYCPEDVVHAVDGRIEIDYEFCKGCGVCQRVCVTGAVEMVREG
ncbi:4Fe-4S binding protein [Geoglobus acetivorans]|uniref:Pyruvate ferredoxin oxidoreductase, delta subunit n=1 Tax=Geoglobus acetivorans TaxID=565033 RepID=A0A0A7GD30_GEOAI|nr:pyruvate ferredoxin oxidoreductase, delta subunit [Geoglobus acetivorans]